MRIGKATSGIALAETMVAVSLFLIIVAVGVGGFARALRTLRQNATLVSASGNISLLLEQMSREMRTGYDFCTNEQACYSTNMVSFKNSKSDTISYLQTENGAVERWCEGVCDGDVGMSQDVVNQVTPKSVTVRDLLFIIDGNMPNDGYQPRITVSISVSPKGSGLDSVITTFQTTISPRFPLDS